MPLHVIIPIEQFGRDHWSTLLYVESCIVDHSGKINDRKMRTFVYGAKINYSTILKDGTEVEGHDDWNCISDMVVADLIESYHDDEPIMLTDWGWHVAGELRRKRAAKAGDKNFDPFQNSALVLKGKLATVVIEDHGEKGIDIGLVPVGGVLTHVQFIEVTTGCFVWVKGSQDQGADDRLTFVLEHSIDSERYTIEIDSEGDSQHGQ